MFVSYFHSIFVVNSGLHVPLSAYFASSQCLTYDRRRHWQLHWIITSR